MYWTHFSLALTSWLLALIGVPAVIGPNATGAISAVLVGFYSHIFDIWFSSILTLSERPLSALSYRSAEC